jgi:hypothetical protein
MGGEEKWFGKVWCVVLGVAGLVREFEEGLLDWDTLLSKVNAVLEGGGFGPVRVVFEDTSTTWDDAYASYSADVIYLSPLLKQLPRKYLARAFLHEVMHHIINTKPPGRFVFALTRRTKSAFALIVPALLGSALVTYALASLIPQQLLYTITALVLGLAVPSISMLLLATREEKLARALTYSAITGTWRNDWVNTEEIFNAEWGIPNNTEITKCVGKT